MLIDANCVVVVVVAVVVVAVVVVVVVVVVKYYSKSLCFGRYPGIPEHPRTIEPAFREAT